jgi:hypothetical protein
MLPEPYFRSHEGLAGKTPAEVAGIRMEGKKHAGNGHTKCKIVCQLTAKL